MEKITKEEIKELILNKDLTITDVIDVVIEINAFVGVGLIILGDGLKQYIYQKISPQGIKTCVYHSEENKYIPHCIKNTESFYYWKYMIDQNPRWSTCPHCGNEIERR